MVFFHLNKTATYSTWSGLNTTQKVMQEFIGIALTLSGRQEKKLYQIGTLIFKIYPSLKFQANGKINMSKKRNLVVVRSGKNSHVHRTICGGQIGGFYVNNNGLCD